MVYSDMFILFTLIKDAVSTSVYVETNIRIISE
jgi:hypothetical protein